MSEAKLARVIEGRDIVKRQYAIQYARNEFRS